MQRHSEIELARLREIGWDEWDPIGIRQFDDDAWQNAAADEYDTYLIDVANLLKSGAQPNQAVEYLNRIASEHMGLGPMTEAGSMASARTVDAIAGYLRSI